MNSHKQILLQVENLVKIYNPQSPKPLRAVNDISFSINAGECFGLLGPNGAGKSTTINCITGFYPLSTGQVFIGPYNIATQARQARMILGLCSQDESLDSDFEVMDQLIRHATFFRISKTVAKKRAEELLARFGLTEKRFEDIESLSGGMRRRLQVARALISQPQVLILDEPSTGLDPDIRRSLWEIIIECKMRGLAILLCTHYMDEAERLCDRVAIISQGKILDIDSPEKLIKKHIPQQTVEEEVRPGVHWKRAPNLEDVYLKLSGSKLGVPGL